MVFPLASVFVNRAGVGFEPKERFYASLDSGLFKLEVT
jgi:hypothetical protein